jgi:hypothetical protein
VILIFAAISRLFLSSFFVWRVQGRQQARGLSELVEESKVVVAEE